MHGPAGRRIIGPRRGPRATPIAAAPPTSGVVAPATPPTTAVVSGDTVTLASTRAAYRFSTTGATLEQARLDAYRTFARGDSGELRKTLQAARFFVIEMLARIKALDLCRNLRGEIGGIEQRNPRDARDAGDEISPHGWDIVADRCDRAQSGDDDGGAVIHLHTCSLKKIELDLPKRQLL